MTDNNLQQCYLPVGCTPFYNTCGTAPGCGFTAPDGTHVLILPGPPVECVPMFRTYGLPYLRALSDEEIVSPVTDFTTAGPVMYIWLFFSVMKI